MNNAAIIITLAVAAGAALGYFARLGAGVLDTLAKLDDQARLLLLTLFGVSVATGVSASLLLYIFASGIRDAVVVGLAASFVTLVNGAAWTTAFAYWFQSSASSRAKDKALAEAAKAGE